MYIYIHVCMDSYTISDLDFYIKFSVIWLISCLALKIWLFLYVYVGNLDSQSKLSILVC